MASTDGHEDADSAAYLQSLLVGLLTLFDFKVLPPPSPAAFCGTRRAGRARAQMSQTTSEEADDDRDLLILQAAVRRTTPIVDMGTMRH
jgi:hypothetical protein